MADILTCHTGVTININNGNFLSGCARLCAGWLTDVVLGHLNGTEAIINVTSFSCISPVMMLVMTKVY